MGQFESIVEELRLLSASQLDDVARHARRLTNQDSSTAAPEWRAAIFNEGSIGNFAWHIERDQVYAHPTVYKIYGSPGQTGWVDANWLRSRQNSDDRLEIDRKLADTLAAGRELSVEFRVKGDDEIERWVELRGVVIRNQDGRAIELQGLILDISERKREELQRREMESRATHAEQRLATALRFSKAVVWRWITATSEIAWSGPVAELFGLPEAEIVSGPNFKKFVAPEDVALLEGTIAESLRSGRDFDIQYRFIDAEKTVRWIAARGGAVRDENGVVLGLTGVSFDVTELQNAQQKLQRSEKDFRELANLMPQIVFTCGPDGLADFLNERYYDVGGIAFDPAKVWKSYRIIAEEDRQRGLDEWVRCAQRGYPYEIELRIWDAKRQEERWYLVRAVPSRDENGRIRRWFGTGTDIHDQKAFAAKLENEVRSRTNALKESLELLREREEQLRTSLFEKDVLLREVHHRVKNNLQIVSSLLSMQASTVTQEAALGPLRDSERRVTSMAMIHEQLYNQRDMSNIEFAEHAQKLSQSLIASMGRGQQLDCIHEVSPVELVIDQAIPCALILNELITNAIKYAYPGGSGGEIRIKLACLDEIVTMAVCDSGVGLPAGFDHREPKSLGFEIVNALVKQLEGTLTVEGNPGASFIVRFRRRDTVDTHNEEDIWHEAVSSRS